MILGIDEVGRGPWAGPLVVGAVVLGDTPIDGLTDSKKLTAKRRTALDVLIREHASGWGLGWVHANELDKLGLAESLRVATIRAIEAVTVPFHEIIIDGTINFLKETNKGKYVTTLPKADLLIPSVSAASIIAKVARDSYMEKQDELYPGYGFKSHVGYGTAAHRAALDTLGITPLHRASFAPIAKHIEEQGQLTSKDIGMVGEELAATYLIDSGHKIVERNWKNRWCEIDIISIRDSIVYFVEVKYRSTGDAGGGLAAISPAKLQQMRFAAELYAHQKLQVTDMRLAVISITGNKLEYLELE